MKKIKEGEPSPEDFESLGDYGEAYAFYKDGKYVRNLYKILKHFKDLDPNSVQAEIAQADIYAELARLSPEMKWHVENGEKDPLKRCAEKKTQEDDSDLDPA